MTIYKMHSGLTPASVMSRFAVQIERVNGEVYVSSAHIPEGFRLAEGQKLRVSLTRIGIENFLHGVVVWDSTTPEVTSEPPLVPRVDR